MTNDTAIQPALTPDEWQRLRRPNYTPAVRRSVGKPDGGRSTGISWGWPWSGLVISAEHSNAGLDAEWAPAIIALCNDKLPDDDPRKITRADVNACLAAGPRTWNDPVHGEPPEALAALAAKLAALLPPE